MSKLTDAIGTGVGVAGVGALMVLVVCLAPMVFLWSLNSLAELGGVAFYIEHSPWSYWVSFVFIAIMRGGSTSKN